MTKKLKTGVLGLGKMGIFHSALINMIPEAELVAVHDLNQKLSKYVKNSGLDVPFYADLDRMFRDVELEAVFICTPPSTHLPLAEACLRRGLHVFVEKPLAESLDSARRMADLVRDNGSINATGYTAAHIPLLMKAHSVLSDGVLGAPHRFSISVYISQVFSRKKAWFFDKSKSGGGVIIDIASHLIYLSVWYFGLPNLLYARLKSFFSDVEDSGAILLDYPSGLTGSLDTNWSLPGYRMASHEIRIEGENGSLEATNDYVRLKLERGAGGYDPGWTTLYKADVGSTSAFDLGSEGFYDEDTHFIRCCLEGRPPRVTWQDGLDVQRVIESIYRSSEAERPFSLEELD